MAHKPIPHTSPRPYIIGFVLSLLLTFEAYILTLSHSFSSSTVVVLVLSLAIVQLLVQLFFFLHLDRMVKTPWNFIMFVCMAATVATIIFGSMWIMKNLQYGHDHTPSEAAEYLKDNEDL